MGQRWAETNVDRTRIVGRCCVKWMEIPGSRGAANYRETYIELPLIGQKFSADVSGI